MIPKLIRSIRYYFDNVFAHNTAQDARTAHFNFLDYWAKEQSAYPLPKSGPLTDEQLAVIASMLAFNVTDSIFDDPIFEGHAYNVSRDKQLAVRLEYSYYFYFLNILVWTRLGFPLSAVAHIHSRLEESYAASRMIPRNVEWADFLKAMHNKIDRYGELLNNPKMGPPNADVAMELADLIYGQESSSNKLVFAAATARTFKSTLEMLEESFSKHQWHKKK